MSENLPFEYSQRKVELYRSLVPNPTDEQIQAIHAMEESDRELEDFLSTFRPNTTTNSWLENYQVGAVTVAAGATDNYSFDNNQGVPSDAPPVGSAIISEMVYHTVHLSMKIDTAALPKNVAMRILEPDGVTPMITSPHNGFRIREQEDYDGSGQAGEPYTWTFTIFRDRQSSWVVQFQNYGDVDLPIRWSVSIQANRRNQFGGG